MGDSFFAELWKAGYPPEVREEIAWQGVARAKQVVVRGGAYQGTFDLDRTHNPSMGMDGMVRVGSGFGMAAGLSPDMVELIPRPNLQKIVKQLQPELQRLIQLGRR